jgi:RNA polymerase-binding transcription factor DksA
MVDTTSVTDTSRAVEALYQLAATVVNEHTNDYGLCVVCGSAFPCERATLAENNLAR